MTVNSRVVNKIRVINVIRAVVILVFIKARIDPLTKRISRWPAVILAVSHIASAIG